MRNPLILSLVILGLSMPGAYAQPKKAQVHKASAKKAVISVPVTPKAANFPVLQKLLGDDRNLAYDYLGKRGATDVWLLSGPGIMQMVYTLPSGYALVGGALVGPDAKDASADLTRDFMARDPQRAEEILIKLREEAGKSEAGKSAGARIAEKEAKALEPSAIAEPQQPAPEQAVTQAAPPADSPAEALWRELGQTGYISYGSRTNVPIVYAILDPAQADSKAVWQKLSPLAKAERITLHVIPLALMSGDSIMEIASVLGSDNPPEAWDGLMQGKSAITGQAPDGQKVLAIEATIKLAQRLNIKTLPFMVYRIPHENDDGKVRILRGMPRDWDGLFGEMKLSAESPLAPAP